MAYVDSLDKVIGVYVAAVCAEPFDFKGRLYTPRPLHVAPSIYRDFTCPPMCGGCCYRFSLEYLPKAEPHPYRLKKHLVRVNGKDRLLAHDPQTDHSNHYCRNLDRTTGRCNAHGEHPFSCDFELLRVLQHKGHNVLTNKLFGRGWKMKRVDGGVGAQCEMVPGHDTWRPKLLAKIRRLEQWCDHFEIANKCQAVHDVIESGPHSRAVVI